MTAQFSITLAVVCGLIVLVRFALPQLPLTRFARRLNGGDVALVIVGMLGLTFHCTAMFFRKIFDPIPAVTPLVHAVNALGAASIALYVVPALLLLIGFRNQLWVALVVLIISLIAVGLTMYLGSPLRVHLTTIFIAVVLIVGILSLLVRGPWQRKRARTSALSA